MFSAFAWNSNEEMYFFIASSPDEFIFDACFIAGGPIAAFHATVTRNSSYFPGYYSFFTISNSNSIILTVGYFHTSFSATDSTTAHYSFLNPYSMAASAFFPAAFLYVAVFTFPVAFLLPARA